MKKRITGFLAWILALALLVGAIPMNVLAADESDPWDGSIAAGFASGTGAKNDPYMIATAEQLAFLASSVNSGTTYSGEYIRLANDIVLNDTSNWEEWGTVRDDESVIAPIHTWTPIGTGKFTAYYSSGDTFVLDNSFNGIFLGDHYTVSGIYINNEDGNQGLFGNSYGVIKDLGVERSYIKGGNSVGGVVGTNSREVNGCYNSGKVYCGDNNVGGVVGFNNGTITRCYNAGTVGGTDCVGGVVGNMDEKASGRVENCYNTGTVTGNGDNIGGVVGCVGGTILNCYNSGTVSSTGDRVGGVVGYFYTLDNESLENCYNIGDVTGSNSVGGVVGISSYLVTKCYNTGKIKGEQAVGGIAGANTDEISFCYNTGEIEGKLGVGGISGENAGIIRICYNSGTITGNSIGGAVGVNEKTVTDCYNVGAINGDAGAGGVIGENYGAMTDCYNVGIISGNTYVGGTTGFHIGTENNCYYLDTCVENSNTAGKPLSDAKMKQEENFVNWDFDSVWEIGFDGEYDYPTFRYFGSRTYKYRLTFKVGETVISSVTVDPETPIICEAPQGYEDYDFVGFETDDGKIYDPGDTIYSRRNTVYTALWTVKNTSPNVWNGGIATGFAGGTGTVTDPYMIETAEQLAYLQSTVDSGTTYEGEYISLNADIVLNDGGEFFDDYTRGKNDWSPIGTSWNWFGGTFDGNGHTVSGIYCNSDWKEQYGLFGVTKNATVKNLGVEKSFIRGYLYMGGVVGYCDEGTVIDKCYHTGNISGRDYVGGVTGCNYDTVTDCYNTGTVSGNDYVGGVAGYNYDTVSDCYNTGDISGRDHVGGVVGTNKSNTVNCYNTGEVSGRNYIGGVVGYNNYYYNNATVTDCYNTGEVKGKEYVGGIAGVNFGYLWKCYNIGTVTADEDYVGGVVGYQYDSNQSWTEDCYYLETCVENPTNHKGTALTETELKQKENFEVWDFTEVWDIFDGMNNGYPVLRNLIPKDPDCIHNYVATVIPPTCTDGGYTVCQCSICHDSYITDRIPAKGHTLSEWIIDTPATYFYSGERHKECTDCHAVLESEYYDLVIGDANGDGVADGEDIKLLQEYIANYDDETGTSTVDVSDGADINGNGYIDAYDLILLKKYLLEMFDPAIEVEDVSCTAGGEVTVNVRIVNNTGFSYLELSPVFPEGFTLIKAENGDLISSFAGGKKYVWLFESSIGDSGKLLTLTFQTDNGIAAGEYEIDFLHRCLNFYGDDITYDFDIKPGTVTVYDPIPGDASGNGEIDAEDLVVLKKALLTDPEYNVLFDANGDGSVDIRDLVRLKRSLSDQNDSPEEHGIPVPVPKYGFFAKKP